MAKIGLIIGGIIIGMAAIGTGIYFLVGYLKKNNSNITAHPPATITAEKMKEYIISQSSDAAEKASTKLKLDKMTTQELKDTYAYSVIIFSGKGTVSASLKASIKLISEKYEIFN